MFPGLPNPSKPVTDNDIIDAYLHLKKQSGSRSSSPIKSLPKPATLPKALKPIQTSHQMKLDTETASLATEHRFTEHMCELFGELENDPIFGEDGLLKTDGSLVRTSSPFKVPLGKEVGISDLAPSRFSIVSNPSPCSTSSTGLKTKDPLDIYLQSAYSALDTVNTFDSSAADVLYRVIKWLVTDARIKPEEVARHKEVANHALSLVADREKVIETLTKEKNSAITEFEALRKQIRDSENIATQLELELESSRADVRTHVEKISQLQTDLLAEEKKFYDMKIERNKLAYRNTELVSTGVELRTQIEEFIKAQKDYTSHDEEYTIEIKKLKDELDHLREQYDDDIVAYQQIVGSKTELIADLTMQCNTAQNEVMILKDKLAYMQNCIMANKTVSSQGLKDGSLTSLVDQSTKNTKGVDDQSDTILITGAAKKKAKPARGICVQIGGDKDGVCIIAGDNTEESESCSSMQPKFGGTTTNSQLLDLPSLATFLSAQANAEIMKINTILDDCPIDSQSKQPTIASNIIKRKIQLFNTQVSKYKELLIRLNRSNDAAVDLDIDPDAEFQITPRNKSSKRSNESLSKKTLQAIGSSSDAQLKTEDIKTLQTIQAILGDTFTLEDLITNDELLHIIGEAKLNLLLGKLKHRGCSTFNATGLLSEASTKEADDSKITITTYTQPSKEQTKGQSLIVTGPHSKPSKKGSQKAVANTDQVTRQKAISFSQNTSNQTLVKRTQKTTMKQGIERDKKLPQDEASQLLVDGRLEGQILQKITDISQIDTNIGLENEIFIEEHVQNNIHTDITEETPTYGYLSQTIISAMSENDNIESTEQLAKLNGNRNTTDKKPCSVLHNRLSTTTSTSHQKPVTAISMLNARNNDQDAIEEVQHFEDEAREPPARLQTPQDQQRQGASLDLKQQAMYTVTAKHDSQILNGMVVKATGPLVSETPIRTKGTPAIQVAKSTSYGYKPNIRQLNDQMVFTPGNPVKHIGKMGNYKGGIDESESSPYSSSVLTNSQSEDYATPKLNADGIVFGEPTDSSNQGSLREDYEHKKKRKHDNKKRTKIEKEKGISIQIQGKGLNKSPYKYIQMRNEKALQYEPVLTSSRAFSDVILTPSHIYDLQFEDTLLVKSKQAMERIKNRTISGPQMLHTTNINHDYTMPSNSILQGSQLLNQQQLDPNLNTGPIVTALFNGSIAQVDGIKSVAKKMTENMTTNHVIERDVTVNDLDLSGLKAYEAGCSTSNRSVIDSSDPLINMAQRAVKHFRLVGKSMQADDTPPITGDTSVTTPLREVQGKDVEQMDYPQKLSPLKLQEHKNTPYEANNFDQDESVSRSRTDQKRITTENLISQANSLLKRTAPILVRTFELDTLSPNQELNTNSDNDKNSSNADIVSIISLGLPHDEKSFEQLRTTVSDLLAKNTALHAEIELLKKQLADTKSIQQSVYPVPSISMSCQSDPNLTITTVSTKKNINALPNSTAADSSHPKRQESRSFYPPKPADTFEQQLTTSLASPPTNSFVEMKSHEESLETSSARRINIDQATINLEFPKEGRASSAVVKRKIGYEVLTHVAKVAHEPLIKPNKDIVHQSELYAHPLVDPSAEQAIDNGFGASLTYDTALTLAKSSISKSIITKNKRMGSPKHLAEYNSQLQTDPNNEHALVLSDGSGDEFHTLSDHPTYDTPITPDKEHHTNRILFRNHIKPLLGEYTSIIHDTCPATDDRLFKREITSARSTKLPILVTDAKINGLKARSHRSASASSNIQRSGLQLFPADDIDTLDTYLVRTGSCKAILMTTQYEEPLDNRQLEVLDDIVNKNVENQEVNKVSKRFLHGLSPPIHGKMQSDESDNLDIATAASRKYNPYMQKKVLPYGDQQTSRIRIQDNCEVVPADLLYKEPTDEEMTRLRISQFAQNDIDLLAKKKENIVCSQYKNTTEYLIETASQRSSPKQSLSRSISPSITVMGKNETSMDPHLYTNAPLSPMRVFPQQKDEDARQSLQSKHMSYPSHPDMCNKKEDKLYSIKPKSPRRHVSNKITESSFSLALKKEELRQRNELTKHLHILEAELALERQRVEMAQANPMMILCNYNPSAYPSAFFQVSDGFKTIMIKNLKNKPTNHLLLRVGSDSLGKNNASSLPEPATSRSKEPISIPSIPMAIPLFEPTEAHQGLAIGVKKEHNLDINEYISFNDSLTYATALDCLLNEVIPLPTSIYNNTLTSSTFLQSYIAKYPEVLELRQARAQAENTLRLVPASCPATDLGAYIRDYRVDNPQTHTYPLAVGDKVTMVFYQYEHTNGYNRDDIIDPAMKFLTTNTSDIQLLRYDTVIYAVMPCHIKIKSISWLLRLIRVLLEEIANPAQLSTFTGKDMTIKRIYLWAKKKYGLQSLVINLMWHAYCSTLFHRYTNPEVEFFSRVLCGSYDMDQLNFYLSLRDPLMLSTSLQDKDKENCDNNGTHAGVGKDKYITTLHVAYSLTDKLFPMLTSTDAYEVFGAILDNSTLAADSKKIFRTNMKAHICAVRDSHDNKVSMQNLSVPVGTLDSYILVYILMGVYTCRRTAFNMCLIDLFEANASSTGPSAGINMENGLQILQRAWPYLHSETILSLIQRKSPNSVTSQILHFEEFVELLAGIVITPPATIDPLLLQARAGFAAAEQQAVKLLSLLDKNISDDAILLQALDSLRQDAIGALQKHCSLKANVLIAEYLRIIELEGMRRGLIKESIEY